jgi:exonuclease SbcC
MAVLEERLQTADYALGAQAQLRDVQAQLAALAYSSADHQALQSALAELRPFEDAQRRLERAQEMLPRDEEALAHIEARIHSLTSEREDVQRRLEDLRNRLPQLIEDVRRYQTLRQQTNEARLRLEEARQEVYAVQQELNAIEAKKQRLAQCEREAQAKRQQLGHIDVLIEAFGKKGVPAMIIESAIPELEDLANDLLRRMTNGRMNVRLMTQRETKAGSVAETLDIEIADELGTRSYEVYSGGEAFRVNFALRVALAKLVARRAGAQVRTLFIDEGFGTQDEEGRLKLVEAITAVQDDFDLILVITHMEDLRDAFPVQIVVEKTDQGSRLRLR